jgi:uncharacterized protein YbjT (DUF2867 family)
MGRKKTRVMVAGATGYIGGGVARALHRQGFRVRALARDPARASEECDDIFEGHATKPETLDGLCQGIDVVFSSIGITNFKREPTLWEVDYQANLNILEQAVKSGVKHFIFVTTLNGPDMATISPIGVAREKVARAIIDSGLDYSIFEPAGFFNDMAHTLHPARHMGRIFTLGDGAGLLNPLSALDFGDEIARVIKDPALHNRVRSVGGPDTITHRNVAEMVFQALGKKPKISGIPTWLIPRIADAFHPFNENAYALIKFFEFLARTYDLTGQPIGHRHLQEFLNHRAAGLSDADADDAL